VGRLQEARDDLGIILEKQPTNMAALVLMSKLEMQGGKFEQAFGYSKQLQEEFPGYFKGYELAADIRFAQQDYTGAGSAYAQALARKKSPELAIRLAESAYRSGNKEEAVDQLLSWLSEFPETVSVQQRLGTLYLKMGRNSEATKTYKQVLAVDPENKVALNNLAWLYMQSENPEAVAVARRAYQLHPDDPGIMDTLGWLLVRNGQAEEGRHLLKQAMGKLAEVSEVRYHYAMALYKTGDKTEGMKIFEQLLTSGGSFEGRDEVRRILMSSN
jgi:Tfp pilus assembly protein PilF